MRLLAVVTHVWLTLLGFRRLRRQLGEWSLVFYRKGRGGEPWVLLHGLGSNALSWSPVARHLAPGSRVLIPELSRLGGSRGPRPGLDVAEGAKVVAELLRRELAGEPATVVGLSLGGWTAVRLALAEPALVSRLILIDSGGYRDQDWETIRSLVTVRDDADVVRLYGALFQRVPWIFRLSRTTFRRVFQSPVVKGILADLDERDLFGPEDIARLQVPVGVIWAEHDGLFSAAVGRQIARAARQGAFYLVPGVGHGLHWEAPRRLVAAMEEAERELPARRAEPVASLGDAAEAPGT
ncbi:MAG TPA: alpha/beta hydrolase [Thermoanaerobaculia bacterium]|nr:alpha/beta hydrolase [Thermoanaerobaculia bacterium]